MNQLFIYLPYFVLLVTYIKDIIQYFDYQKSSMAFKTKDYLFYLWLNHIPFMIIAILSMIIRDSNQMTLFYIWTMLGIHLILRVFATYFVYLNLEKVVEQKRIEFKETVEKMIFTRKEK